MYPLVNMIINGSTPEVLFKIVYRIITSAYKLTVIYLPFLFFYLQFKNFASSFSAECKAVVEVNN